MTIPINQLKPFLVAIKADGRWVQLYRFAAWEEASGFAEGTSCGAGLYGGSCCGVLFVEADLGGPDLEQLLTDGGYDVDDFNAFMKDALEAGG